LTVSIGNRTITLSIDARLSGDVSLCASKKILTILSTYFQGERNHSPHRVEFVTERRFALEEIKKYLSVILVRDPFVRLLSSFLMKVDKKGKSKPIKEQTEGGFP